MSGGLYFKLPSLFIKYHIHPYQQTSKTATVTSDSYKLASYD